LVSPAPWYLATCSERTNRPRAIDLPVGRARRNDPRWLLALLDPFRDGAHLVEGVGALAAAAKQHTRQEEQLELIRMPQSVECRSDKDANAPSIACVVRVRSTARSATTA